MTGSSSYGNFEAKEGTVDGVKTIVFNLKPRKIIITNDESSTNLGFKFNESESCGTLGPTETICLEVASKTVFLQGTNVAYRVWGIG